MKSKDRTWAAGAPIAAGPNAPVIDDKASNGIWLLAVFAITFGLTFARMPQRLTQGFLWAEDASIFLKGGYEEGFRSIFAPYAGYLHAVPRLLVAAYASVGSPVHAPLVLAWVCAIVLAGAATLLFTAVYRHVGRVAAMCFALALIVVPQDGEIWLTVTNLQWILGPLLLVLLWREFVAGQVFPVRVFYLDAALIVLLALTGPFGLVFSVFVIGAAFIKGRHEWARRTWGLFVAYGLALTAQMVCLMHASSQGGLVKFNPADFHWISSFLRYFVLDFLSPASLNDQWSGGVRICLSLIAIACCGFALYKTPGNYRFACAALLFLAVLFWALGIARFGRTDLAMRWAMGGSRYLFVPFVFCFWTFVICLSKANGVGAKSAAGVLLLLVCMSSATGFASGKWPATNITSLVTGNVVSYRLSPPPGDLFVTTIKRVR
ncbi:hypothetical protein B0G71_3250 [Paraburkholderia sp. BL27I4N3]|uniref:hypothetical protein n=1 Tax=Paraburkholderia sp. BL27I4N3 TaxID=1938805 RepID=UPI000E24646B|nr:hypothetical protein [Paraburkholderia sp. BL27I4N3]REE20125.1 hypothetical protein B0G71_3250 [Paraburkholderia sp. BL27I4N3]